MWWLLLLLAGTHAYVVNLGGAVGWQDGFLHRIHRNGTHVRTRLAVADDSSLEVCTVNAFVGADVEAAAVSWSVAQKYVQLLFAQANLALAATTLPRLQLVNVSRDPLGVYTTPDRTLDAFRTTQGESATCVSFFFGQRDFADSNVVGIAYLRGACRAEVAFGAVFNTLDADRALVTLLHEYGHLLGAPHADDGIMQPSPASNDFEFTLATTEALRVWHPYLDCLNNVSEFALTDKVSKSERRVIFALDAVVAIFVVSLIYISSRK